MPIEFKGTAIEWYKDSECLYKAKEPLNFDEYDDYVYEGDKVSQTFYLKNISKLWLDDIQIKANDEDVSIMLERNVLAPNQSMAVNIEWSPHEGRKNDLSTEIVVSSKPRKHKPKGVS